MGTEVDPSDMDHVVALADQVVELSAYRTRLADYLRARMQALAPNFLSELGPPWGLSCGFQLAPVHDPSAHSTFPFSWMLMAWRPGARPCSDAVIWTFSWLDLSMNGSNLNEPLTLLPVVGVSSAM